MFGNESVDSKIFSYGAKAPTKNISIVDRQIWLAHRYRNDLVKRELDRRADVQDAIRRLCPDVLAAEEAYAAINEQISIVESQTLAQNARSRNKSVAKDVKDRLAALRKERKAVYTLLKAVKAEAFQRGEVQAALAEVEAADVAARKELRAASGLYWGNYLPVEQAMSTVRKGPPPKFHRWTGEGKIAVQIQGGMTGEELFSEADSRLQVAPLSEEAAFCKRRIGLKKTVCRMRIGSEGRNPIWAEIPFTMHRPLPTDIQIKWAYLVRRKVGTKFVWKVQFVVSAKSGFHRDDADSGVVGIDVGWRLLDYGLRVAYWCGSDGQTGEVVIPTGRLADWSRPEEIQAERDINFDRMILDLRSWLTTTANKPDWLIERTAALHSWKSQARLAALVLHWRDNRFDGDDEIYGRLEAWRREDKRRCDEGAFIRLRGQEWRKNYYRNFAADMRRRYRVAVAEKIDLKKLQERPGVEQVDDVTNARRRYAKIASCGQLLAMLGESMTLEREDSKDTTRCCAFCGAKNDWDQARYLVHTCGECGQTWDQDANAARNLLNTRGKAMNKNPVAARNP